MSIRVGIVGISGFGGGEAMRLVASHPSFELVYAAGDGSADNIGPVPPLGISRNGYPGESVEDSKGKAGQHSELPIG